MRYEDGELLATAEELAGAAAALRLSRGPLSTTLFEIGGDEQARAFEDGLVRLADRERDIFETALPIACDPVRSAVLHSMAKGLVSRRFLAWSGDGALVSVEKLGAEIGLRVLEAEQLKAEVLAALGSDIPFGGSDVRLSIEARDAIALVATADALRREWLASLLNHTPSRTALAASNVAEVIAASTVDDPRWTSCLLGKIVPAALQQVMDTPTTELALQRLARAGVLAAIEGDQTAPTLYSPTEDGAGLVQGIAGAMATVAMTVYGMTDEGPGYESTLFARDASTVWTVMVSPAESFVASASPTAVSALVEAALGITR